MPTAIQTTPITEDLIYKAESQNKKMAGYLSALKKLGLCGSGDDIENLNLLKKFLRENEIEFECSKRNMLWLKNKISENLRTTFLKD